MRILEVELKNVRHLRRVKLELTSPVTVISGGMGVGKTTIQEAILRALFHGTRQERDRLISSSNPDSKPEAVLRLSRGGPNSTITLSRTLTDDQGTWEEDGRIICGKGRALAKIQESLPISADAAALLLWGLQEKMSNVLNEFPQEGRALLTAAVIRGGGPDPCAIVDQLNSDIKKAKVAGAKNQGTLTQARNDVVQLTSDLERAREAYGRHVEEQRSYATAKATQGRLETQQRALELRVTELEQLVRFAEAAVQAREKYSRLAETHDACRGLGEQIGKADRERDNADQDRRTVATQLRVARDDELGGHLTQVNRQIAAAAQSAADVASIEQQLRGVPRPDRSDMEEFSRCRDEMREASHRMDASGFKYRLSSTAGSECIEVSEEQEPQRELELDSEKPLEGVAGRLTIRAGNLRIAVTGKEDVARHKDRIEEARRRLADLRARFSAVDDSALAALANEREQLQSSLRAAQATLERTLSGKTLDELRQAKADLEHRRRENNVSEEDRAACAGRYLAAPAVLEKEAAKLEEAWKQAKRRADDLLASQRSDAALQQLETDLNAARLQAETADQQFLNADSMGRQPTSDFLTDLRQEVAHFRNEQRIAMPQLEKARESATRLAEAIKHSAPVRSLSAIEAELAEAQAALYREEVLQEARQLLAQRIDQTMVEMAAAVPEDLASRISSHLAELSEGALARVRLDADLKVTSVTQETGIAEHWTPEQLSVGQRTLAALTLKIAVARAIAETQRQPVFIILDDSLVNLDPEHRTATERLLGELAADGQLQVILLTCHTDWARAWQQRAPDCVRTIELQETADYYRQPLAATVN